MPAEVSRRRLSKKQKRNELNNLIHHHLYKQNHSKFLCHDYVCILEFEWFVSYFHIFCYVLHARDFLVISVWDITEVGLILFVSDVIFVYYFSSFKHSSVFIFFAETHFKTISNGYTIINLPIDVSEYRDLETNHETDALLMINTGENVSFPNHLAE